MKNIINKKNTTGHSANNSKPRIVNREEIKDLNSPDSKTLRLGDITELLAGDYYEVFKIVPKTKKNKCAIQFKPVEITIVEA